MKNIAIIGSGSWGVALAIHLARIGHNIKMWSFSEDEKDLINNERKCKFLPRAIIPDNIMCTTDFKEAIDLSEIILLVTPSKVIRGVVQKCKPYITDQLIIICSKGFEKSTLYTLNEVVEEELPNLRIGGLSGPSHAEEVSEGILTDIVIASKDKELKLEIQETFTNETLRVYTSSDIKGAELRRSIEKYNCFLCRNDNRIRIRR